MTFGRDTKRASTPTSDDSSTIVEIIEDDDDYKDEKKEVFVEIEVSRSNTMSTLVSENQPDADVCPDGGLRAWLVVAGVSHFGFLACFLR